MFFPKDDSHAESEHTLITLDYKTHLHPLERGKHKQGRAIICAMRRGREARDAVSDTPTPRRPSCATFSFGRLPNNIHNPHLNNCQRFLSLKNILPFLRYIFLTSALHITFHSYQLCPSTSAKPAIYRQDNSPQLPFFGGASVARNIPLSPQRSTS